MVFEEEVFIYSLMDTTERRATIFLWLEHRAPDEGVPGSITDGSRIS